MQWIRGLFLGLILLWITDACAPEPVYSEIPEISLASITFKPGNLANHDPDTLILTVNFKDGDGDLGIDPDDSSTAYSSPWYFAYDTTDFEIGYTADQNLVLPGAFKFIDYQVRKKVTQFDTLPDINCNNWELSEGVNGASKDSLYIQQNPNGTNINIDVYTSADGGVTYTKFDPATKFAFPLCNVNLFNGRFPILSSDLGKKSPLEGVIIYKIQSVGLRSFFGTATLKMDVQIRDRAFHTSNVAEKKDFTLTSVTTN